MSDITIRDATDADTSQVCILMSTYFHDVTDVSMDDFAVAEKDGRIIGAAAIVIDKVPELHSIAIHPDHRGRNLGAELFEYIRVKNSDCGDVYVRTTAARFFSKLGFRELDASLKAELWDDCAVCDRLNSCRQSVMCFVSGAVKADAFGGVEDK
jgi:amino-acid N-acetyltransferase